MLVKFFQRLRGLSGLGSHSAVRASALAIAGATLAGAAAAEAVAVDPDVLRASIVRVESEGALCPSGSLVVSISEEGDAATAILSQSVDGVQTAGCRIGFVLDVPAGFAMRMPTTILRGVSLGSTRLERRYSFEGAGASNAFIEVPPDDFVITDVADGIESRSCEGSRRVRYTVDVTAQLQSATTFFQLDSVDIDTTFRFGTDFRFCDVNKTIAIEAGSAGDFCGGPQARPCAAGLSCDRRPNAAEGSCAQP